MTITNGYCTLAELREHLLATRVYTASTISFDGPTKTIADTARGLRRFVAGQRLLVSGSVGNNTWFTVSSVATTGASLVVAETVTTGVAGVAVTIADTTDTYDDAMLERAITVASRQIDAHCNQRICERRFYKNSTDETRYFTADATEVFVDDLVSVTTLKTDNDGDGTYETTFAATDYSLQPRNAVTLGRPYTRIMLTQNTAQYWPSTQDGIQIVGVFGWPAVPDVVKLACLLQASHLYRRKDSPDGIASMTEYGAVRTKPGMDGDAVGQLAEVVGFG